MICGKCMDVCVCVCVCFQEAHQVLHDELGFDQEKTRKLIQVYDRNGDRQLSYEEFIWFYWKIQEK